MDVVREYYAAILLLRPTVAAADTIARLSSEGCVQCKKDGSIIRKRALAGETILDTQGDPVWGTLVFSRRSSTGPGLTTIRVAYNEAPGDVVDRNGRVVDGTDKAQYFELLFVVKDFDSKPKVASITRIV